MKVQYYEYEFTGAGTCNGDSGQCSVLEQQKELAAIKLGEAACAGTGSGAIASCILDAYNTLVLRNPENKDSPLVGGNYNFDWEAIVIQGEHIDPSSLQGCMAGRCGIIDSLHFYDDGTFHVDTGNPLFVPIGSFIHLGWDAIGGWSVWKTGGLPHDHGGIRCTI